MVEPKKCLFVLLCNCDRVQMFPEFVKKGHRLDRGHFPTLDGLQAIVQADTVQLATTAKVEMSNRPLLLLSHPHTLLPCYLSFFSLRALTGKPFRFHSTPSRATHFLLGNYPSSRVTLFCRYTIATLIANILNSPYLLISAW